MYEVWQKSNETDFLFIKVLIVFKHQCYSLQNSSLGQLHTDGDVVLTFGSSVGILQPVWSSACPLRKSFLKGRGTPFREAFYGFRLRKRAIRVSTHIADIWMLKHGNAPSHTALSVTEYFNKLKIYLITFLPHLVSWSSFRLSSC